MRCGARLVRAKREGRVRHACRRCGWIYFKNPASASAVAIVSEGRVVLVKRRVPPHVGSWCLPAGFQEYDEGPEETAVREVKEETNLDIRLQRLHTVFFSTAHPGKNTVVHVYLGEKVGGAMRPGDDVSAVRLFPLDKLPSRIAFTSHLKVIRHIAKSGHRRTHIKKSARGGTPARHCNNEKN
jgi:ADP-ribose pyrophosphatase YjhB (NUDIX family)